MRPKLKKKIIWRSRPEVHKVAEPEQMAPLSIHKSKTVLDWYPRFKYQLIKKFYHQRILTGNKFCVFLSQKTAEIGSSSDRDKIHS